MGDGLSLIPGELVKSLFIAIKFGENLRLWVKSLIRWKVPVSSSRPLHQAHDTVISNSVSGPKIRCEL